MKTKVIVKFLLFFCTISSLGLVFTSDAATETRWLTIVGTEKNLSAAIHKLEAMGGLDASLELISSSDCQNLKPGMFLVVAGDKVKKNEAEAEANKWRTKGFKDTYNKICEVTPYSRLDIGVRLLDASIYNRPKSTVNWTYEEGMSQVRQVSKTLVAVIQPRFEPTPEDVLEGLRLSVGVLIKPEKKIWPLEQNCIDPELAARANIVAVSCVNATAADHLLHVTRAYELPSLKIIHERDRCRQTQVYDNRLICQEEDLDKEGNLKLKPYELYMFKR